MLKTIKRVVAERTGCRDIRLRVVMYRTPKVGQEVIDYYNLREEFDNNVEYVWAYDKAVPIETYLGTFYGLEKAYDADKFIYVYYDDPRELYCHKMYRKSFKAFTMNMARYETRSIFHSNMGDIFRNGAAGDVIPMAIYDSGFVQSKYAFSCFLRSSPAGLVGVDADRDLYALDDRIMTHTLREYALPYHLYRSVSDFNMIIEGGRWSWYMAGGGIVDGAMINGYKDSFDLDDNFSAPHGNTAAPGLKTAIINQAWYGITFPLSALMPTILVGDELAGMFKYDTCNKPFFMFPGAKVAQTLPEAYAMSKEISGSDRFLVFDGSFGFVNCSRSMAEELIRLAPSIRDKVNNELYPKYMKQRGLELPK